MSIVMLFDVMWLVLPIYKLALWFQLHHFQTSRTRARESHSLVLRQNYLEVQHSLHQGLCQLYDIYFSISWNHLWVRPKTSHVNISGEVIMETSWTKNAAWTEVHKWLINTAWTWNRTVYNCDWALVVYFLSSTNNTKNFFTHIVVLFYIINYNHSVSFIRYS